MKSSFRLLTVSVCLSILYSCSSPDETASDVAYTPNLYVTYVDSEGLVINLGAGKNLFEVVSAKKNGEDMEVAVWEQRNLREMNVYLYIGDTYFGDSPEQVNEYDLKWKTGLSDVVEHLLLTFQVETVSGCFTKDFSFNEKNTNCLDFNDFEYFNESDGNYYGNIQEFQSCLEEYWEFKDGEWHRYKGGMKPLAVINGSNFHLIIPIDTEIGK